MIFPLGADETGEGAISIVADQEILAGPAEESVGNMLASKSNICPRCSKRRIVVATKEKVVDGSLVVFSTVSCPDADCQKMVHQENQKNEQRRMSFVFAKSQAEELRLKAKAQNS